MNDRVRAEIDELHRFFEGWMNGTLPSTPEVFDRFRSVMVDEFERITPDGQHQNLTVLTEQLWGAHGVYAGVERPLRIRIESVRSRLISPSLCLATYEEWQETPAASTARLSTAVFEANPTTPNQVCWVHVHEVWLASDR